MTVKELKEQLGYFNDDSEIELINWSNMETQDFHGIETDDAAETNKTVYISFE